MEREESVQNSSVALRKGEKKKKKTTENEEVRGRSRPSVELLESQNQMLGCSPRRRRKTELLPPKGAWSSRRSEAWTKKSHRLEEKNALEPTTLVSGRKEKKNSLITWVQEKGERGTSAACQNHTISTFWEIRKMNAEPLIQRRTQKGRRGQGSESQGASG